MNNKPDPATKYKKSPNAPRRFKSAYMFFSIKKHKDIRQELAERGEENKVSTTQVAKMVSQAWKDLSKEQREEWEEMARLDKARYQMERTMYKGPWMVLAKKRTPKNPDAPKRPMSAFLAYSNSKRGLVKRQNPGIGSSELSRKLSEMWRDASEKERKHYVDQEFQLRQEYKVNMAKWRENFEEEKRAARTAREEKAVQAVLEARDVAEAVLDLAAGVPAPAPRGDDQSSVDGTDSEDEEESSAGGTDCNNSADQQGHVHGSQVAGGTNLSVGIAVGAMAIREDDMSAVAPVSDDWVEQHSNYEGNKVTGMNLDGGTGISAAVNREENTTVQHPASERYSALQEYLNASAAISSSSRALSIYNLLQERQNMNSTLLGSLHRPTLTHYPFDCGQTRRSLLLEAMLGSHYQLGPSYSSATSLFTNDALLANRHLLYQGYSARQESPAIYSISTILPSMF